MRATEGNSSAQWERPSRGVRWWSRASDTTSRDLTDECAPRRWRGSASGIVVSAFELVSQFPTGEGATPGGGEEEEEREQEQYDVTEEEDGRRGRKGGMTRSPRAGPSTRRSNSNTHRNRRTHTLPPRRPANAFRVTVTASDSACPGCAES